MKALRQYIITGAAVVSSVLLFAQQQVNRWPHEQVTVVTDRSLYIAGEQIRFSAVISDDSKPEEVNETTVLYSELITPDGTRVTGGKFRLIESQARGCVKIPAEISSGYYYFRAYTKLMRNEGPEAYSYNLLKIINPLKNDVLTVSGQGSHLAGTLEKDTGLIERLPVSITTDKLIYRTRDTVHLRFSGNDHTINELRNICLAVVPEQASLSVYTYTAEPAVQAVKKQFFPENRGITLTGKLIDAIGNAPIAGVLVNLSIIGEGRDFMAVRTDSAGGFYFSLPYYPGNRDLFICAARQPGREAKILVDNEFCTLPIHLPAPAFELREEEKATAYQMAANALVQSVFSPDTTVVNADSEATERPFYGTPSEVLYIDRYIQLPTLEDYFNELPLLVKVKKRKGEKYFKVYGAQNDLDVFDPLVLIDHVAVDDPEKILKVLPQNVARIEIVNEPYVKGSQTYGGIISIISKRGDFAGIDLPSSGIFINYLFLDDSSACGNILPTDKQNPDTRNTLSWQPDITAGQLKNSEYVFTTGDSRGRYKAVLRGISPAGKVVTVETVFTVE